MSDTPTDILDTSEAGPAAVRGGVFRVAGYLLGTLLAVGSAAALLRYLSVDDFGRYATVLSLVTIVSGLTEAGMTNIGVREWSIRDEEHRRAMLRNLLGLRIVLTAAGVGLAVVFAVAVGYPAELVEGTAVWGAGIVAVIAALTYSVPLQSQLRLGWVSALDLLRQTVTVGLILVLIVAGASLLALLAVPLPAGLAMLAAAVLIVRGRDVPLRPAFDRAQWAELLRVTLPFAAASAVGIVYVYVSQVLMSLIATEQETGLFGASFRIFIVLVTVPALLVSSALPILARAARDDRERLSYATNRLYDVCLVIGAWSGVCLALAAPVLIDVVAGPKYGDSVGVLRIHGVALGFSFVAAVGGYTLISLHRHRALLVSNAAALAVSVVLTVLLGGSIGAPGAAIANTAGEATLVVGYGAALVAGGLRFGAGPAARVLAATVVAVAAGIWLPAVAAVVVATVLFFGVLAALGGFPPEARELLGRLRGSAATPPAGPPSA